MKKWKEQYAKKGSSAAKAWTVQLMGTSGRQVTILEAPRILAPLL
jgi:hypothetical protein